MKSYEIISELEKIGVQLTEDQKEALRERDYEDYAYSLIETTDNELHHALFLDGEWLSAGTREVIPNKKIYTLKLLYSPDGAHLRN